MIDLMVNIGLLLEYNGTRIRSGLELLELDGLNADSLVKMLKVAFSWDNWTAMIEIADKLFETAVIINDNNQFRFTGRKDPLQRSIAYYFGFSLCMKGIALQRIGNYHDSKKCIERYADLSWVYGLDEEGEREVQYYRVISKANANVIELLEGNTEVLPEYVDFLSNNTEKELLPGLITVLESAIKHNYSVDWVLAEFEKVVQAVKESDSKENKRYYIDYMYLLAVYQYKRRKIEDSINLILHILLLSGRIVDGTGFKKSVAFYEKIRNHATPTQQQVHDHIMNKILEKELFGNEEKVLSGSITGN